MMMLQKRLALAKAETEELRRRLRDVAELAPPASVQDYCRKNLVSLIHIPLPSPSSTTVLPDLASYFVFEELGALQLRHLSNRDERNDMHTSTQCTHCPTFGHATHQV